MTGQCCFRYPGRSRTVISSTPGLPLLALTRANVCLQFSRSQTSSISCSSMAGLSALRFAASDSVPSAKAVGASLLLSSRKASTSWFFCRLSLASRPTYSPLPLTPYGDRSAFAASATTSPSADFCRPVRDDRSPLSLVFETNSRSAGVSSSAFSMQPPDLQPVPLMDTDFAVSCPLVRHRMPQIRFLYIGSRLCSALLSDSASRRRPCASLSLHVHHVVKRTCTS